MPQSRQEQEDAIKFRTATRTATAVASVIEHRWHWAKDGNSMIWDIDFHPVRPGVFLTAAADGCAKVWKLNDLGDHAAKSKVFTFDIEFRAVLPMDNGVCTAARWSPSNGHMIATGHSGLVVLWRRTSRGHENHDDRKACREHWTTLRRFQLNKEEDVHSVSWTADQRCVMAVTSVGQIIIWRVDGPSLSSVALKRHHPHACHANGIAVDPLGMEIATAGDDRKLVLFGYSPGDGGDPPDVVKKATVLPDTLKGLLHQDRLLSQVRRPCWSPDGVYLLVPSAYQRVRAATSLKRRREEDDSSCDEGGNEPADTDATDLIELHGCRVYARGCYSRPVGFIPAPFGMTPTAAAWCPRFYKQASDHRPMSVFDCTDYRMMFAVACHPRRATAWREATVLVYDTMRMGPLLQVDGVHCKTVSSLAWSNAADLILSCGHDGYVAAIEVKSGVLGEAIAPPGDEPDPALPESLRCVHDMKRVLAERGQQVTATLRARLRDKDKKTGDEPPSTPQVANVVPVRRKKPGEPAQEPPRTPTRAATASPVNVVQGRPKPSPDPSAVPANTHAPSANVVVAAKSKRAPEDGGAGAEPAAAPKATVHVVTAKRKRAPDDSDGCPSASNPTTNVVVAKRKRGSEAPPPPADVPSSPPMSGDDTPMAAEPMQLEPAQAEQEKRGDVLNAERPFSERAPSSPPTPARDASVDTEPTQTDPGANENVKAPGSEPTAARPDTVAEKSDGTATSTAPVVDRDKPE